MMSDAPYVLFRSGHWDHALALLPSAETTRRAEILVDRFWWRHEGGTEAEALIDSLPEGVMASYLRAQLAYTRVLFNLEPHPNDVDTARRGFESAARQNILAGWGQFWLGVLADNVAKDPIAAAEHYAAAAVHAPDDSLLESYVTRHQGFHLLQSDQAKAVTLLRRSYVLRSALGARPNCGSRRGPCGRPAGRQGEPRPARGRPLDSAGPKAPLAPRTPTASLTPAAARKWAPKIHNVLAGRCSTSRRVPATCHEELRV